MNWFLRNLFPERSEPGSRTSLSPPLPGTPILKTAVRGEVRRQKAIKDAHNQDVEGRAAYYRQANEDARVGPRREDMIPRPPERRASAPEHDPAPWYANG